MVACSTQHGTQSGLASADYDDHSRFYIGARFYDAQLGRFVSRDPIGYRGGTNIYRYVEGSPTTAVDPSGLDHLFNPWTWGTHHESESFWEFVNPFPTMNAYALGFAQGGANTVNGLQDAAIAIPNLVPLSWNVTAGNLGAPKCGYIPSPDWSKDLIVVNDPTHKYSKFAGGQGAFTLITLGFSQIGNARYLTHITTPSNATSITSQGIIQSRNGIYALSRISSNPIVNRILTLSPRAGGAVQITGRAAGAFRPIPAAGPITAWTRFIGRGYVANASQLNLASGATVPLRALHWPTLIDLGLGLGLQGASQYESGVLNDQAANSLPAVAHCPCEGDQIAIPVLIIHGGGIQNGGGQETAQQPIQVPSGFLPQ